MPRKRLRSLICALALVLSGTPLLAEPVPMFVAGEDAPELKGIVHSALQGFVQEEITHITFHHEGFAGSDAALFARAHAARKTQSAVQRVRNIHAYHARAAGLGMIAYHYAIGPKGEIVKGRPVRLKPATRSRQYDTGHLADFDGHFAVMLLGDFNHERPTPAARAALVRVMSEAQRLYRVPSARILPHRHHAATACPGTHLLSEAPALAHKVLIHSLQVELRLRGCGDLVPDGLPGPATQAALKRLASRHGARLPTTSLDDALLQHLLTQSDLRCAKM